MGSLAMRLHATVVFRKRWPLCNLEPRSWCEGRYSVNEWPVKRAGRWVLGAACVVWSVRGLGFGLKTLDLGSRFEVLSGNSTASEWQFIGEEQSAGLRIETVFLLLRNGIR